MLTPTAEDRATAKAVGMTFVRPEHAVTDETLQAQLAPVGLNPSFTADLFSAFVTHERCGRHLYRSVAQRTANPVLQLRYTEFGEETERHVEIYEALITAMGGDPAYVSPLARAVEGSDSKLLESTFLLGGSVNLMAQESVMLDAVFLAESMCQSNWVAVGQLAERMDEGPIRDQVLAAYEEVAAEEDEHIGWATEMRSKLIVLQADHSAVMAVGAKAKELVATVKGWFA
jgi:rubrerythrin